MLTAKNLQMTSLNLGSGLNSQPDYINIDIRFEMHPDIACDISQGLPFTDNSVDRVRAYDFLEHIPIGKTIFVIEEIWRVLKPLGILEHLTPSSDGRGAFQDPFHVSFWNENSWWYYMDTPERKLYGIKALFAGENKTYWTNKEKNLVYVYGELMAIK